MANDDDHKQKKGVMYVYKLDTGGASKPPPKKGGWGLLKRSKTYRETDMNIHHHQQHYEKEEKKEVIQESGRKSVSVMEGGGRNSMSLMGRRSVGNTAEMSVGPVTELLQVRVLVTDMPAFMQIHAFRCARQTYDSLEKFSSKQIALNLKKVTFQFLNQFSFPEIEVMSSLHVLC